MLKTPASFLLLFTLLSTSVFAQSIPESELVACRNTYTARCLLLSGLDANMLSQKSIGFPVRQIPPTYIDLAVVLDEDWSRLSRDRMVEASSRKLILSELLIRGRDDLFLQVLNRFPLSNKGEANEFDLFISNSDIMHAKLERFGGRGLPLREALIWLQAARGGRKISDQLLRWVD